MTEKTGGSDVSQSETVAEHVSGNLYKLRGYKYFTSATTADVTFTLARTNNIEGSKGLSLFVAKLRNENGELDHMRVHKLKDKLGTRTLPTAEIELLGTEAQLIGEIGKGVKTISHLFNVTRLWTTMTSCGTMYRLLAIARDFAKKRVAFGKPLAQQPAHILTIARLEMISRANLQFFVKLALLIGEDECEPNATTGTLLRLLTHIAKLFTAKQAMEFVQEILESFGSPGYMEDTGLPRAMRDSQVNTIWEGTTNVLSLDVLRALSRDRQALDTFISDVDQRVQKNKISSLDRWTTEIKKHLASFKSFSLNRNSEYEARDLAFSMARIYCASLLIEHANWTGKREDLLTVDFWCSEKPLWSMNLSPKEGEHEPYLKLARL